MEQATTDRIPRILQSQELKIKDRFLLRSTTDGARLSGSANDNIKKKDNIKIKIKLCRHFVRQITFRKNNNCFLY